MQKRKEKLYNIIETTGIKSFIMLERIKRYLKKIFILIKKDCDQWEKYFKKTIDMGTFSFHLLNR